MTPTPSNRIKKHKDSPSAKAKGVPYIRIKGTPFRLAQGLSLILIFFILFCNVAFAAKLDYANLEKKKTSEMTTAQFLDLVECRSFLFFWNEANPETGLIKDRTNNFREDKSEVASTASVGFGLTAICTAEKRGWITYKEAYGRVLNTLKFYRDKMYHNHGFFYHFVDMNTGERVGDNEVSSIDTALFLAGALFAGEYFGGDIKKLANEIYERVDWQWMMAGGDVLSMGWKPEGGFLAARWGSYSEHMILYLLAIGSPTHPIAASTWHNWSRPIGSYAGNILIECPPLFTHQYSHIWVDFRDKHDAYANYFENSVQATLANRAYCIELSKRFKTFSENVWGLTAADGPNGYMAYGGKPGWDTVMDGTVAPTAPGGSIVFAPELSIAALKYMFDNYRDKIWGKYGFADSFNLDKNWIASDVIGLDQGAMMLMIENHRSGMIWKYFMKNKSIQNAMKVVGFVPDKKLSSSLAMIDLSGKWRFSKGDDLFWKSLEFDDSNWMEIEVPGRWEDEGFKDYDGFGWYRITFEVGKDKKKSWRKEDIVLQFGSVDDVDSVYFNGKKIGGLGQFPPLFKTAYDRIRIYRVPQEFMNYGRKNTVAVRVFDKVGDGGILNGPIRFGPLVSLQYKPIVFEPTETIPIALAFGADKKYYTVGEEASIPIWILNNTDEDMQGAKLNLQFKNETTKEVILKKDLKLNFKGEASLNVDTINYELPTDLASGTTYGLEAKLKDSNGRAIAQDIVYIRAIKTYDLSGRWLFAKGDDSNWARAQFEERGWMEIDVPKRWEDAGFSGYDGYAWYRVHIKIPEKLARAWAKEKLGILFGGIDDCDEVYLNGVRIGSLGKFPPNYETAWNQERIYSIPQYRKIFWFINIKRPIFNAEGDNVLAVRVYDAAGDGGIVRSPVRVGPISELKN